MDAPKRKYHGVTGAVVHLHPADTGGVPIFRPMEEWESRAWGGQAWPWHQRTDVVGIVEPKSAVPIQAHAQRFGEFIGRGVDAHGRMELDESYIDFVQGNSEELDRSTAIAMRASEQACRGCEFEFARTKIRLV